MGKQWGNNGETMGKPSENGDLYGKSPFLMVKKWGKSDFHSILPISRESRTVFFKSDGPMDNNGYRCLKIRSYPIP